MKVCLYSVSVNYLVVYRKARLEVSQVVNWSVCPRVAPPAPLAYTPSMRAVSALFSRTEWSCLRRWCNLNFCVRLFPTRCIAGTELLSGWDSCTATLIPYSVEDTKHIRRVWINYRHILHFPPGTRNLYSGQPAHIEWASYSSDSIAIQIVPLKCFEDAGNYVFPVWVTKNRSPRRGEGCGMDCNKHEWEKYPFIFTRILYKLRHKTHLVMRDVHTHQVHSYI